MQNHVAVLKLRDQLVETAERITAAESDGIKFVEKRMQAQADLAAVR